MKIILITGMSGSGKTSICKDLLIRFKDRYNFVNSYTDREKRSKNEWGHEFIDSKMMDLILERSDIVAKTKISHNRYCTIRNQFDENKVNLYTVDLQGVIDTIEAFPQAEIMVVLIRRRDIEVECIRKERDVQVPIRESVKFIIDNNGKIELAANLLNALVNFDLFDKPSHVDNSITDTLDYIDEQYRFLDDIKESLYEQLWYENQKGYNDLCKYVEEKINEDFNFNINVIPDKEPCIYDGYLVFNIQGEYDDDSILWEEINRLVERLSYHSQVFCMDNGYEDISYRLTVSEKWAGEEMYE